MFLVAFKPLIKPNLEKEIVLLYATDAKERVLFSFLIERNVPWGVNNNKDGIGGHSRTMVDLVAQSGCISVQIAAKLVGDVDAPITRFVWEGKSEKTDMPFASF